MEFVEKMPQPNNVESEMEEGEIVDELDDLSDISSEEEFLLRQRLEVLESYNNVLERKKAKRSSMAPGSNPRRDVICQESIVSPNALESQHNAFSYKHIKVQKHVKPYHSKPKPRNNIEQNINENIVRKRKDYKKKSSKKKQTSKIVKDSSDESEDEYRNKRRKLAEAVNVHKTMTDKSSLSARLFKMMHNAVIPEPIVNKEQIHDNHQIISNEDQFSPISSPNMEDVIPIDDTDGLSKDKNVMNNEPIELSTDDDVKIVSNDPIQEEIKNDDLEEQKVTENNLNLEKDSDDDLELLRQHALESKPCKVKATEPDKTDIKLLSEDEDSDTTELRLICLKSAWLKKVIEMKQKQKRQRKLSTTNLQDDLLDHEDLLINKDDIDNNTDIESVDMEMGSDTEEKLKECHDNKLKNTGLNLILDDNTKNDLINCAISNLNSSSKEDELDEDEDLLRAKLLTSLSKNLTNLVSPKILDTITDVKNVENSMLQNAGTNNAPEEKTRFIIKVGDSDSEGEHEATKNLTKMHMKLAEQIDFQQKLDMFLKSARSQVEKNDKLPDVVKKSPLPKKPEKFVAKTVKHLPKSEQIEYKNLVRRMAELEKLKQSRQAMINLNKHPLPGKDTLKPRNVTVETQSEINNNLEEQIAQSRKRIAEESAKMLKLKDEATKLSQKYKIAATELRNISTAIALNKKQQRSIQNSLTKIRLQHQSLLKNTTTSLHSNSRMSYLSKVASNKLQKENNPKDDYQNPNLQKTVRVSVVNDLVSEVHAPKLSVRVDIASNKKVVTMPDGNPVNDRSVEVKDTTTQEEKIENQHLNEIAKETGPSEMETGHTVEAELVAVCDHGNKRYYISVDDYKSPLDALGTTNWKEDPNAILCPFEVQGQCKDADCKYLHTTQ